MGNKVWWIKCRKEGKKKEKLKNWKEIPRAFYTVSIPH